MAFKMKGPLKHMGYEVNIKKGKVVSEKEKPHNKFKTETEHEEYHNAYPSKPFTDAEGKPFKMKGSPMKRNFGIGADSPMKETTTQTLQGMSFNPYAHQALKASDIPSFRDMVSLEQQQAARKAWKEKRAERKAKKHGKKHTVGDIKTNTGISDKLIQESEAFNKPVKKFKLDPLAEERIKFGNTDNVMGLRVTKDKSDPLTEDRIKYGKPNNAMNLKIDSTPKGGLS